MGLDLTGSSLLWVLVLFTAGLVCIIKGGDFFVDAAAWMAEASGIPKFIIGCTVVSFATTLPEMLVSVFAALEGNADIAVGNAVGSVTANTGLILCLSLVCMTCSDAAQTVRDEGMSLACGGAGAVRLYPRQQAFCAGERADPADLCRVSYREPALRAARAGFRAFGERGTPRGQQKDDCAQHRQVHTRGGAAIVLGAQLLIDNGSALAGHVGVPDAVIAATMIAVGTSLPELVTTITAIRQKAVYTFRGQHHRRKHHGSDGDSAAVRPNSGPPAERGKSGYAAGYSLPVSSSAPRC